MERRDDGREEAGGVCSVFGATLLRWTLPALVVGAGVGVLEVGGGGGGGGAVAMFSLRGILMVPAL